MRRIRTLVASLALGLALAQPAPAQADAPETVIQDDAVFLHGSEQEIRTALQQVRELGIDRIRITAGWSVIAPEPDAATPPVGDLSDPAAYPQDRWFNLDRAIRLIHEAGLRAMIDVAFWAPRWATREPADAHTRLRTHIDPQLFAAFSGAVARRYAGGYVPPAPRAGQPPSDPPPDRTVFDELLGRPAPPPPPADPGRTPEPLPAVDLFTVWNEPNHPGFLLPQWEQGADGPVPRSPHLYRQMVHAAYPAIRRAAPGSRVLIGGLASIGGSVPGKAGVPPLRFLRELACVDERLRPRSDGPCAGFEPVPGDGWAHHPYSLRTLPERRPRNPDHLPVAATDRLLETLDALVLSGRLTEGNRTLYQTEYGYETNPPDPRAVFSLGQQAELLARAERIGTADRRVAMWPQFLLRDRPGDPAGPRNRPFGDWQSGLLFADGTPKPAFSAFRTPTVAWCVRSRGREWIAVWSRQRGASRGARARVEMTDPAGAFRARATRARPRPTAARSSSVAVSAADRPTVRYLAAMRNRRVRLTWSDGARTFAGATVRPAGCRARVARATPRKRGAGSTGKRRRADTAKRGRGSTQRKAARSRPASR